MFKRGQPGARGRLGEIVRFLIGGVANTVFTYAIYLALLAAIDPMWAYTISFATGIVTGYAISTYFVFNARWSWKKLVAFPIVHVVNYAVGGMVLWIAMRFLQIDPRFAPLLSICATLPINYLLSRLIVRS